MTTPDYARPPVPGGGDWGGGGFTYAPSNGSGSVDCSGAITATFTQPAGTSPPPAVIVIETATASWSGPNSSGGSDIPNGVTNPSPGSGPNYTATRYTVINSPGSVFTTTCTPYASFSGVGTATSSSGGAGYVSYTASASPVSIKLVGPIQDSSGNYSILVGQHCTASLVGIPGTCAVSYQWGVTGTTFQMWSADTPANGNNPYNEDASYYVGGPGRSDQPTAAWYWNDLNQTTEQVTCMATVTPPAGQGAPFTVSLTQKVTVYRPKFTATGAGGYMQVNANFDPSSGDYRLWAGPIQGTGEASGMQFVATVSSPPAPAPAFGDRSLELVQLIIPNASFQQGPNGVLGVQYFAADNGQEGLDTDYPYGWTQTSGSQLWYYASDNPGIDLTHYSATAAKISDQFEDYLMYFAPGSAQCIPLERVRHFASPYTASCAQ